MPDLPFSIDVSALRARLDQQQPLTLVDVREAWELDLCRLPNALHIPLAALPQQHLDIPSDRPLVVMCHHGGRSAKATQWLRDHGRPLAQNLEGGIDAWARTIDPSMRVY